MHTKKIRPKTIKTRSTQPRPRTMKSGLRWSTLPLFWLLYFGFGGTQVWDMKGEIHVHPAEAPMHHALGH